SGGEPCSTLAVDCDAANAIIGQPSQTLPIRPSAPVIPDRAEPCTQPDFAIRTGCQRSRVVIRQAFSASEQLPLGAISNTGALRAEETQSLLRVEYQTTHVGRTPATSAIARKLLNPITACSH